MSIGQRTPPSFFRQEVTEVAPQLLGKTLVRKFDDGSIGKFMITEVEAYRGTEDLACHASKGRTARTEVMFHNGGLVYVYLIYGMYWMLNFVTGTENEPTAVLIRGLEGISGPGRVGRTLQLDKSFYGEDLSTSERIWLEESDIIPRHITTPRIGINYAGEPWISKHWRFVAEK
ncbi:DNA-3-methyladenine glycosylase [Maribellus sp. YY47]|uniref:DNA-3-methyladenine glycosylase n=1 Tax=Maribellus sp. YY47 TaxID=2929486 RepID=UPI0020009A82|nr:DNA-3-methyladenine glycosylase [Maribellus sp. YY47]MCK3683740.1 DNA-3-methyladenine glycosylase [Maribellus sp. YY47]